LNSPPLIKDLLFASNPFKYVRKSESLRAFTLATSSALVLSAVFPICWLCANDLLAGEVTAYADPEADAYTEAGAVDVDIARAAGSMEE
jgi:hypothetical protein